MWLLYIFGIIASIFRNILCQDGQPLLSLQQGKLQGTIGDTHGTNKTYYAFRGIPFAEPPLGDLRFRAPEKAGPWNGTLNATEDKSQCVQMDGSNVTGSEDCLYVNVYTPQINASLAVMVWLYGGGFYWGNSSYAFYNPENFLDENVVFVSFNYRLGVFGFLSTGNMDSPGNWGLKDQVLALEWIKENVKHFGGDPNNLTVFGQSAGGASISYLIQSFRAKGLFNRAIMESGTSLCLWALTTNAPKNAFELGARLGLNVTDTKYLVAELRKIDYVKLKQADNNVTLSVLTLNALAGLPFGPVMEPRHRGAFFTGKSHELLKRGEFNRVPVIIGYNSIETGFFKIYKNYIKPALYDADIAKLAPYDLTWNGLRRVLAGILIKWHYFRSGTIQSSPTENLLNFVNEDQMNRPIRETAHQMSKYTSVYFYIFSYVAGASHEEELQYLFRTSTNATQLDKITQARLLKLWTNFAKFGNPTLDEDSELLQNVQWLKAKQNLECQRDDVNYLDIGSDLRMLKNPNQTDWTFYRAIYRRLGDCIYTTY